MRRARAPSHLEPRVRPRAVPLARATSDVTRFRGVWLASGLGSCAVVLALWLGAAPGELSSPGALSEGHARAGLDCESCHTEASAMAACESCHVAKRSRRAGHQRLALSGQLTCNACHQGHAGAPSLVFERFAEPRLAQGSRQLPLGDKLAYYTPEKTTIVPLVRQQSCAGCHRPGDEFDPASMCFDPSAPAGEPESVYQRCFDEHRAPAEAPAERDAAWAASAELLHSKLELPTPLGQLWGSLGLGFLVAVATWGIRRKAARWRSPAPAKEPAAAGAAAKLRLPQINTMTCLGCDACVDVCPFDVLETRSFVAVVARPDACCGVSLCEQACPNGSLVVRAGETLQQGPRMSPSLESLDVPGLYLAGDLTGLALIRNAINQGAEVAHAVAQARKSDAQRLAEGEHDLLVVGTGPAGLSAVLEATKLGLKTVALEQGNVAESIRSFPRHKLVLAYGVGVDARASLWLEQCEKEELVRKWVQVTRSQRLPILEGHRVRGIERATGPAGTSRFSVRASTEQGLLEFAARRVLLASGKRGSPRKLALAVPEAWQSHVHYALLDAKAFAGRAVLVVGLGDTAMEAAIALATQPGCQVTVSARASDFSRGKAQNIEKLQRLAGQGRVRLLMGSSVASFTRGGVELHVAGELDTATRAVACDSVFVLIGAELPWAFLEAVGVKRGPSGTFD